MKEGSFEIERLIRELKVNDKEEIYEGKEEAIEPREVIDKLIKIGSPAVDFLLPLLNHPKRYSCAYAVKVLGEIGDSRAATPLVKLLATDDYLDLIDEAEGLEDAHILALEKIGPVAISLLIEQVNKDKNNWSMIWYLCEVSERVHDEKAFQLMTELLSSEDSDIQGTVIDGLIKYGDKTAIQYLHPLLKEPKLQEAVRGKVFEAFRKLGDLQTYRQLLREDAERRLERFKNSIESPIRDLKHAYKYPEKFKGDGADNVGIFVREYKIRMAIADLLRKTLDLSLQEATISDKLKEELDEYINKIEDEISKLPEQCQVTPEIARAIVSKYYPTSLKTEEKTFKNLREKREQFISGTSEWLRSRGFRVIVRDQWLVWAWQGEPPKLRGIVVTFGDSVTARLWGEAWTDEEATSFLPLFWQSIENVAYKLLGLPLKGVRPRKEVVSWDKWKEILMNRGENEETIAEIEKSLTYCYVCTRGGKSDLDPSRVARLDVLTNPSIRFVQVAKCKEDPLSQHGARTCRVQLARLTEEGLEAAKEITLRTLDGKIEELLTALSNLPERERGLIEWFMRQWLTDKLELWDIVVPCYSVSSYETYEGKYYYITSAKRTILPQKVLADAEKIKQKLFSLGLVAYAWEHTTKGYREIDRKVTCPAIANKLSEVLRDYELNSYLRSCRRATQFLEAKLHLLMNFQDKEGIRNFDIEWFSKKFEIPQSKVVDWLEEIHRYFPDLVSDVAEDAMSITRYPATVCRAINKEKLMRLLETENSEQVYSQCTQNVREWFTTELTKPVTIYLMVENNLRSPLTLSDL